MAATAGRKALVKVSGAAVAFTDEATTANGARTRYQITNTARRVWDRTVAIVVERDIGGGGFSVVPATEYTLNRLKGTVIFGVAQASNATIRLDGSYLPMSTAAEAKSFSVECSADNFDASKFGDSYIGRKQALKDVRGTLGSWRTTDTYFDTQLTNGAVVVLEFFADSANTEGDLKVWAILNAEQIEAVVDGGVEQAVEWEGTPDADKRAVSWDDVSGGAAVSDGFNRADSTTTLGSADTGQAWVVIAGTWGINTNRAYLATAAGADNIAHIDSTRSDATVQVTAAVLAASTFMWLVFRLTDAPNHWIVEISPTGLTLFKRVAGTYTNVGSFVGAIANGDVISAELVGAGITVKQNGTTRITTSDAFNQTATKHGIATGTSGTPTALRFDDFTVT